MPINHYSNRFAWNIWLTHHTQAAMSKRGLDEEALLDVIETGTLIEKGNGHWWIHKHIKHRQDNLVCVAVVMGQAVIVKTVMVDWQIREDAQ